MLVWTNAIRRSEGVASEEMGSGRPSALSWAGPLKRVGGLARAGRFERAELLARPGPLERAGRLAWADDFGAWMVVRDDVAPRRGWTSADEDRFARPFPRTGHAWMGCEGI